MQLDLVVSRDKQRKNFAALVKPNSGDRIGVFMVFHPQMNVYGLAGYTSEEEAIAIFQGQLKEAVEMFPEHAAEIIEAGAKNPVRIVPMTVEEINSVFPDPKEFIVQPNPEYSLSMMTDAAQKYWDAGKEVVYAINGVN